MSVPTENRTVFRLAASHLLHEWVLTLCLVFALAAVIAPLLTLLGLKEGTIAALRERLVEDPIYREIRPAAVRAFEQPWFHRLGGDPRIAFVMPNILPASSVIQIERAGQGSELIDLLPTGPNDPLLLENGGTIPKEGECVITAEAARQLGVGAGGTLRARVTRSRGGRSEAATPELKVVAVLDPRAGGLPRLYATLDFVLDVESYKEGRSVPRRGWEGESPHPYLSYQGITLVTPETLDPVTRTGLVVNTGLLHAVELAGAEFRERWGFALPEGRFAYRLSIPSGSVPPNAIQAVARKLRGKEAIFLPEAGDLTLTLDGKPQRPVGLSLDPEQAAQLGLSPLPWGRWEPEKLEAERLDQLLWEQLAAASRDCKSLPQAGDEKPPAGSKPAGGCPAQPEVEVRFDGIAPLRFPLKPIGAANTDRPILPAELMGLLRTAQERHIAFAPDQGFLLENPGFRGFRLYTKSIDDVPDLVAELRKEGVDALAEVEAIQRIRTLDRGLTLLFRLIALLGVVGGCAVLVASLYAAVERERRDLGILRLLGLTRSDVARFPVYQGGMIAVLGFAVGLASQMGLALLINDAFGHELAPGQQVSRLPPEYAAAAMGITLLLAILSSLVAAWRATGIEPAEAIREE